MATLTWHASKYKIHKLHQRYSENDQLVEDVPLVELLSCIYPHARWELPQLTQVFYVDCVYLMSFGWKWTPFLVDSVQALWASLCSRLWCTDRPKLTLHSQNIPSITKLTLNSLLIRGDGGTLDSHIVLFDGIGTFNSHWKQWLGIISPLTS